MHHLHANKFEAFHLEPLDDLSNDAPLHTIGLDGDEGAFGQVGHDSATEQRKQNGLSSKHQVEFVKKNITHGGWWHLALSALGPASEGADPIAWRAQRRQTAQVSVALTGSPQSHHCGIHRKARPQERFI